MRILFLNTYPEWGGDEQWNIYIGKGLQERGHDIVISCKPGSETEKRSLKNGLTVFPFDIGLDVAFWKIPPFYRFLKKQKIQIVVCSQNRDVKIGALAAKIAGVPVVFARQALDTIKKRLYHHIAFNYYVDGIITNSRALKALYMTYGWFKDGFIHPIHDGIYIPKQVETINLNTEFGFPEDSVILVGAGRIVWQKGFDLLIQVARIVLDKKLNWKFLILGTGKLEKELKASANQFGVEDIIKFPGFRSDVLSIMKSAALFVLSSRSESMTHVLREAMVVGKACVATNVFGIAELIEHEKSGYIVPPENPQALFDGINYLLSNPDIKSNIEKNAKERIKQAFTMDRMITETEDLFKNQLEKKGFKVS